MAYLAARGLEGETREAFCRRESDRLAAYLRETGMVELPQVPLQFAARPDCALPQRAGAEYLPDHRRQVGTLFLGLSEAGAGESRALLRARCLEATWGGAHLLAFAGGDAAARLPRRFCARAGFPLAWNLYLRERLYSRDYCAADDRLLTLLQRRDAIQRGLLDLELHLGHLERNAAHARLGEIANAGGLDLAFIARHPGSVAAGVLGWLDIDREREARMRADGDGFSEAQFNGRLIARGAITLSLALDEPSSTGESCGSGGSA